MSVLNLLAQRKPQCLPQISLITQTKPKTTTTSQTVFCLRNNAACCIPLRNQRYLRENIHMRVLKIYCTNETPMSPADLADDADEPQTTKPPNQVKQH